jgi:energy-coupling factor transport system substrate-specific component
VASAWIGLGAGLLPRGVRGRKEIAMLSAYGVAAAYVFGLLMNLWSWPYTIGAGTDLSFVPGAPLLTNLHRFIVFTLTTSALGWDTGRAITNAIAIVVLGPAVLATLRRASRRASFGAVATYSGDLGESVREPDSRSAGAPQPAPVVDPLGLPQRTLEGGRLRDLDVDTHSDV